MVYVRKFQSILMLIVSNASSALIIALGTVLIARFVSPNQYGLYSYICQVSVAFYPLLTLRYEQALPMLRNRKIARSWFVLGLFGLLLIMTSLMAIIVAAILITVEGLQLGGVLSASDLPLVLFMSFTFAIVAIFQFEAISENRLSSIALARVVRAVVLVVCQFGFVFVFGASAIWLVIGDSVSNIIQAIMLSRIRNHDPRRRVLRRSIRLALVQIFKMFSLYLVFPTVNLAHLLSHGALGVIFATSLGAIYGQDALGQYFLMRKLLFGVLSVFITAVYQNAVAEASQSRDFGLYYIALRSLLIIGMVCIFCGGCIFLYSANLFDVFVGPQWVVAGQIAVASLPLILFEPLTSVMHFIAVFLKKQKNAFLVSLLQGSVGIIALVIAGQAEFSLFYAILTSSATMATVMCCYNIYLFNIARKLSRH